MAMSHGMFLEGMARRGLDGYVECDEAAVPYERGWIQFYEHGHFRGILVEPENRSRRLLLDPLSRKDSNRRKRRGPLDPLLSPVAACSEDRVLGGEATAAPECRVVGRSRLSVGDKQQRDIFDVGNHLIARSRPPLAASYGSCHISYIRRLRV